MPRVRIGSAIPDRKALDGEIARLRDLDVSALRARWHTVFRRQAPPHLPRHLVFRILAYRLQVDHLGDLDTESQRLLDRAVSPEKAGQHAMDLGRRMPISAAKPMRAGPCYGANTTTEASRTATPTALPCSGFWTMSEPTRSM